MYCGNATRLRLSAFREPPGGEQLRLGTAALGLTLVILLAASCGRSTPLAAGSAVHAQSVNGFVDAMSSAYRMIAIAVFVLTVPVAIALRTEANSDTRDDAAARNG